MPKTITRSNEMSEFFRDMPTHIHEDFIETKKYGKNYETYYRDVRRALDDIRDEQYSDEYGSEDSSETDIISVGKGLIA